MRTCHYCKQLIDDDTLTVCPCGAGLPAADPSPPLDPAGNPGTCPVCGELWSRHFNGGEHPKTGSPVAPGSTIGGREVPEHWENYPLQGVFKLLHDVLDKDPNATAAVEFYRGGAITITIPSPDPTATFDPTAGDADGTDVGASGF